MANNLADMPVVDMLDLGPLFEHALDAIIVVDPNDPAGVWRIVACNSVTCEMNGYARQELIGAPFDLIAIAQPGHDYVEQVRQAGRLIHKAVNRHKDGALLALESATTLLQVGGHELLLIINHEHSPHLAAETALRESQERFQTLFAHSPDGIFLMEPNATLATLIIIDCNDAACLMNGYSREELIGQDIHLLSPVAFDPIGRSAYLERLRAQGSVRSSGLHRRKDGTTFPVEFSSAFVQIDGRDMLLGIDRDVTERQRLVAELQQAYAELESRVAQRTAQLSESNTQLQTTITDLTRVQGDLRRSEERYRSLIRVSADIIWVTTPDGLSEDSSSWRAFTGQTASEASGWGWLDAIHPDERASVHTSWLNALQSGTVYRTEYRVRRHDGAYRTFAVRSVPVLESDGSVREWVGSSSDITSKKAEEQRQRLLNEASAILGASLDYAATLTNVANLAVPGFADWCTVDMLGPDDQLKRLAIAHTDPRKVGRAWKLDRPYPAAIAARFGPSAVVRTDLPELASEIPDDMLRSTAQDSRHLALLRRLRVTSYISVPLRTRGRVLGAVTFLSTRVDRRYSQADLEFAEELARRASLAIDNASLYREAHDALRAREDFLSVAAHELKTPLTSILGYTQLLRARAQVEGGIAERDQHAVSVIHEQAERLHRLIESMLDLSRLQAGQFEIEPIIMDLARLTRNIVDQLQPTLDQHTVAFRCQDEPLLIRGDEGRLDEVVHNLINNAIKYSPHGGPVTVTLDREGATARLAVSDRGIGVPAAVRSRIFERFYRAINANPVQVSGMGIGLYVVKEIVTRHGGSVVVESVQGQGSTFIVRLPLMPDTTS